MPPPRNRSANDGGGGSQGVQRSYASQLKEHEPLFTTYEHLKGLPRSDSALTMLRKVASMVKPIMRKQGWRVEVLAEFLPPEANLLGLNINKGYKICIRLRYPNNPDLFLPIEQVVDTMLHELSHNVWGAHDSSFHKLWNELRSDYEVLVRKGYTGEGFLSEGRKLGGRGNHVPPSSDMRRLARASAEKRKAQGTLGHGSGQRLGGAPLNLPGRDMRQVIADQVSRRNQINRGCASGRNDAENLSNQSARDSIQTQANEDDANDAAIAQALFELMEQEEAEKLDGTLGYESTSGGLEWSPEKGLYQSDGNLASSSNDEKHPTEEEQLQWAMKASLQSTVHDLTPDSNSIPSSETPLFSGSTQIESAPPVPHDSKPNTQSQPNLLNSNGKTPDKSDSDLTRTATSDQGRRKTDIIEDKAETVVDLTEATSTAQLPSSSSLVHQWACEVCTCINPTQFLACDACGVERPRSVTKPRPKRSQPSRIKSEPTSRADVKIKDSGSTLNQGLGWKCVNCGSFMEHQWWTCSACGMMKASS